MPDPCLSPGNPEVDQIAVDIDLKLHPVHNDPNDEILIMSNDNVQLRASKFHLIRTSQFFAGFLGTSETKRQAPIDKQELIHLDFPSSSLSLFLDLSCSSQPCVPTLSVREAILLVDFIEFAICDNLIDHVRDSLRKAGKEEPFELLVIASERNDLELAKHALRGINSAKFQKEFASTHHYWQQPALKIENIKKYLLRLSPAYHIALINCLMDIENGQDQGGKRVQKVIFREDWCHIANKFDPN